MEKQRTKLGARILSDQEMKLVLPNAESIYDQISIFRNNISDNDNDQEYEQKTNNIGIMGCRGAGKTSILRTFHNKFVEDNKKGGEDSQGDVILPIIIPENMSSDATLMDVILGMLKAEVEKRSSAREKEYKGECIYTGRNPLEKEYDEVVKKYCYIKKDYRNILIQQFTTEQYYVDKTKDVFNSDTEFIRKFNTFIKLLLNDEQNHEQKHEQKHMMFLFIDDIDLSTTRCSDVVKTLLSYLSNPQIVTFISGDIQTFEEALTLDFLRQEKALDKSIFENNYLSVLENEDDSLLKRKKSLAYEYLKKIIPPAYRRSIKRWSLEERGLYQVADEDSGQPNTLSKLLVELTKDQFEEAYFVYQEENEGREESKILNVTFHMFDDTSRGLNNVYNVLQELCAEKTQKKENFDIIEMWRLIETIVDSKQLYAKYKKDLLEKIIVREQETVKVHFDNGLNWLYGEQIKQKQTKEEKKNKEQETDEGKENEKLQGFTSEERFVIFLLTDFVSKLFLQQTSEDANYGRLKNHIIEDYINDENIDEKIASSRDTVSLDDTDRMKSEVQAILLDLLRQGDFIFDLYFIKYLGRDEICRIMRSKAEKKDDVYKVAYTLARTIWALRSKDTDKKNYLADLYSPEQSPIRRLLGKLPRKAEVIFGQQLTKNIVINPSTYIPSMEYNSLNEAYYNAAENTLFRSAPNDPFLDETFLLWAEYFKEGFLYGVYHDYYIKEKTIFKNNVKETTDNLVSRSLAKTVMDLMKTVFTSYRVKKLDEIEYEITSHQKEVITEIDKKDLWNHSYVRKQVYPYLERMRTDYIVDMQKNRLIFDATEIMGEQGAYTEFIKCYKGSSGKALAYSLQGKLMETIYLLDSSPQGRENFKINGKFYMRLEHVIVLQCLLQEFLKNHSHIRYGKKEIRILLMAFQELPLVSRYLYHNELQRGLTEEERVSQWKQLQRQMQVRDRVFFDKIIEQLKRHILNQLSKIEQKNGSEGTEKTEYPYLGQRQYLFNTDIDNISGVRWKEAIINMLQIKEFSNEEKIYLKYLYITLQIKEKEEGLNQRSLQKEENLNQQSYQKEEWEDRWSRHETIDTDSDYIFYLHSYLRYLQSTDTELTEAGIRAEKIEKLVEYILDSEKIADDRIYSNAYELIGEGLGLAEEEFETLFV